MISYRPNNAWLFAAAVVFSLSLVLLVVARYTALSSNVADLGFFLTNFANSGAEWQRAVTGHVQPLMIIWGEAYRFLPPVVAPVFLLTLQSLALIFAVLLVGRFYGLWASVALSLYYPVWVNALFDFHFDHLSIPILALFFIACELRSYWLAVFAGTSLIFIKEPFALQAIACGMYLIWLAISQRAHGSSRRVAALGSLLITIGGFSFVFMVETVIPFFAIEQLGDYGIASLAFSWLGPSVIDMIQTIISQPFAILSEVVSVPGKWVYLLVIFGLLGFIPLLRPAPLLVALPIMLIALLSRFENYYGYANHYTAGVIVPVIVAFSKGLPVARSIFGQCISLFRSRFPHFQLGSNGVFDLLLIMALLGGHWALASSPISRLFWSDKVWSYSWQAYWPDDRVEMIKSAIATYVPEDPAVSVSSQNTLNWYHLAHRKHFWPFPLGVVTPQPAIDWSNRSLDALWLYARTGEREPTRIRLIAADYVVLDLKRPWFIVDRGCDWLYGKCENLEVAEQFLAAIEFARRHYETVFERDGFMILRKKK